MIRCVIVDDEEMAVQRLRREIDKRPGWEIIASCMEYHQAKQTLLDKQPDVCFMDINIISGSGMELAKSLSQIIPTQWIFSTAYSEYALDAFEIDAVGYLLKPFENSKLIKLLRKVESTQSNSESVNPGLSTKIAVKSIGEVTLVDFSDIIWIKGAANYVELHCKDKMHLHRQTIANIERKLPQGQFVRVHRSNIINLDFIDKIGSELGRYSLVEMKNGDEVKISSAYKTELFNLLGLN